MDPRPQINFQRTPVTLIVAAVAVALELVCTIDPARRVDYYNNWLGLLPRLWAGELWRPFTSTLLHGGLIHAAFNVYWLVIFGPPLETRFGSYRYLGLIVLLGYVSMMPEYVIGDYHISLSDPPVVVGLSGIVYGLFGILFVGRRWRPELNAVCDHTTSVLLLGWFVFCIVATHAGVMNIANIAHGAGFAFGVLYGLVAFDARHRIRWAAAATVASLVVLSTLVACPGHNGYEYVKHRGALWIFQPRHIRVSEATSPDGHVDRSPNHEGRVGQGRASPWWAAASRNPFGFHSATKDDTRPSGRRPTRKAACLSRPSDFRSLRGRTADFCQRLPLGKSRDPRLASGQDVCLTP